MNEINLTEGLKFNIFADGELIYDAKEIDGAFNALNIPNTEEYHEARIGIFQKLLVFGEIDLSPAYAGHSVLVKLVYA